MQIGFPGSAVLPRSRRGRQSRRVSPHYVTKKRPRGETAALRISHCQAKHSQPSETISDRLEKRMAVCPFSDTPPSSTRTRPAVGLVVVGSSRTAHSCECAGSLRPHVARFSRIFLLGVNALPCVQCAGSDGLEISQCPEVCVVRNGIIQRFVLCRAVENDSLLAATE